jgi:hypothetical protein
MLEYSVSVDKIQMGQEAEEGFGYCHDSFLREEWRLAATGQIHRDHAPAVIVRNLETGEIVGEYWYRNGAPHRDDGPAFSWKNQSKNKSRITYFLDGKQHRTDGPADMAFEDGYLVFQYWRQNGKDHRVDGPSSVYRSPETDRTIRETWSIEGKPHRVGGPASIECSEQTGVVEYETWCLNGVLHRTDGPADIVRDVNSGEVVFAAYHVNGVHLPNGLPMPPPTP